MSLRTAGRPMPSMVGLVSGITRSAAPNFSRSLKALRRKRATSAIS
jgi:hypothetical protein